MAFIEGGTIHLLGIDIMVKRHEPANSSETGFRFYTGGKPLFDTGDPKRDKLLGERFTALLEGRLQQDGHEGGRGD